MLSLKFGFKMLVVPFKRQVTVGGGGQTVFSVMKVQGGAMTRAATSEEDPPSANRNRVSRQLGTHPAPSSRRVVDTRHRISDWLSTPFPDNSF